MIIYLCANTSWYLYNFRRNLIRTLIERGHSVTTIAPHDRFSKKLQKLGCKTFPIYIDNKGTNPLRDIRTFVRYLFLYSRARPDVIANFTIKPVIYSSLSASFFRIQTINTITGLGTAFLSESHVKSIVQWLFRLSLRRSKTVYFQNKDDKFVFLESNLVDKDQAVLIHGSGVDLTHFAFKPLANESTDRFVLISRMLWDKGIGEFIEAARTISKKNLNATFQLVGPSNIDNRTAIPDDVIQEWSKEGIVEYMGMVDDIRSILSDATCVVLPSYREGLSRILMEASAVGRPIITTDVPGCRDIVTHGYNGLLCQPRDSVDLTNTIQHFMKLPQRQKMEMGQNARIRSEDMFDQHTVNQTYVAELERAHNHPQNSG